MKSIIIAIRRKQFHTAAAAIRESLDWKFAARLDEEKRAIIEDVEPRKAYTCVCESNWLGKDMPNGKFPVHRAFNGQGTCEGSGKTPEQIADKLREYGIE